MLIKVRVRNLIDYVRTSKNDLHYILKNLVRTYAYESSNLTFRSAHVKGISIFSYNYAFSYRISQIKL